MDVPQLLLVGLVLLLGLVGVLVPGVPGTWLVWAGLLRWALHERPAPAWSLLRGDGPAARGPGGEVAAAAAAAPRTPGHPPDGGLRGRGAVLGFVLVPVLGAVPGFVGGVYLCERLRLGGHGEAWTSTRAVMRAVGPSVLVELFACLLVVGAWVGAVSAA
ncbi:DUF456 domain-containing protein [Streptomyces virginiae]|uniref:DUF456 domain-containing protein n=1 Tax=Streptomyces virginiae TaxID=1961 RepID=UPI0036ECC48D